MNSIKRILLVSDSLGFPREQPELVKHSETYASLLQTKFKQYTVYQLSIGGASVGQLHNQVEYLSLYPFDFVVFHYGIVDASPRSLSEFEVEFIKRIPLFSKALFWFFKKLKKPLRKYRGMHYTSLKEFEKLSTAMSLKFKNSDAYALGIIPASAEYESLVPGISSSISKYNRVLQQVFASRYIPTDSILFENGLMSDHHHLNKSGHEMVMNLIAERVKLSAMDSDDK